MSEQFLSLVLTVVSRSLLLRDRLNGRMAERLRAFRFEDERFHLMSGKRRLAAVYVSAGEDAPAFLICHGIGERVEYWGDVQSLLKEIGISSLVFNYTGFGASGGRGSAAFCEEDAVAAFEELVNRRVPAIFLLGFSLGSGIASTIASRVDADGVILCEGFSSLREAAVAAGLPRCLTLLADDVWQPVNRVSELSVPVLVVHSKNDQLFPLAMAERVVEACGQRGEAIYLPGFTHNDPIFAASESYWRPIALWAKKQSGIRLEKA